MGSVTCVTRRIVTCVVKIIIVRNVMRGIWLAMARVLCSPVMKAACVVVMPCQWSMAHVLQSVGMESRLGMNSVTIPTLSIMTVAHQHA